MIKRRNFIGLGAAGVAAVFFPVPLVGRAAAAVVPEPFSVPLKVPPVLRPVRRTATTDYYEMTVRESEAIIVPGHRVPIRGYDGEFPGPTIRAFRGRRTVVTQHNRLDIDTAVHLHGAHVPSVDDGQPADPIHPGGSRVYTYENRQPAATLWYHDHTHHLSAESVYRGLSGLYLLEDPADRRLGLPSGPFDLPLILRDAHLDENGELVFIMDDFTGRGVLLVNGRPQPYADVAARRYRLRLVNGSNERYYTLRLDPGTELVQIASDGGLLPEPIPADSVTLSPGERVDVVVDFGRYTPGTRVVLVNDAADSDSTREVMRFDVGHRLPDASRVPAVLRPPLPPVPRSRVHRDVTFSLDLATGMFLIDGKQFDMDRVDAHVRFGDTETWRVLNKDVQPSIPHNMHIHGVHFRVLDRNGNPVSDHETGWKDTVAVPPGGDVRFAVTFDHHRGRYPYHCHLIDHEAMGMMAQMEIA